MSDFTPPSARGFIPGGFELGPVVGPWPQAFGTPQRGGRSPDRHRKGDDQVLLFAAARLPVMGFAARQVARRKEPAPGGSGGLAEAGRSTPITRSILIRPSRLPPHAEKTPVQPVVFRLRAARRIFTLHDLWVQVRTVEPVPPLASSSAW